jgi:tripartite-type tricarboxylate transporter receptor subunit TctC
LNWLNAAINRAMASADVVERFGQLGMASHPNTTTKFNHFLKAEVLKWAAVLKSSGAKVD